MYILWSLINTAFIILFFALVLTLFSKGKKLFNNKYGNFIIVIFVIGVLGILNAKDKYNSKHEFPYDKAIKTNKVRSEVVRIEKNLASTLLAIIDFKDDNKGKYVPVSVQTIYNGFIGGYEWELISATINSNNEEGFSYDFKGVTHWRLFGFELYTQSKDFTGTLTLEEY